MSAEAKSKKDGRMSAAPSREVIAPTRHSGTIRGSIADETRNPARSSEGPVAKVNPRVGVFVESWTNTTLGELVAGRGKAVNPAKTPYQKFELYSVPSFPRGQPEIVTGEAIGSSKQLVEPRTVLLSKINPRINRAWVVGNFTTHQKIASTEWITFPPSQEVVPEFLCYFLQQNEIRDFLARNASGVGGSLMRVKPATLRDFPFAYPPLEHQREIVAEIEKQFTRLDAGVSALRRVQANLKRYRAAVLKAACEGRLVPTEAELAEAEGRAYETGEQLLTRILADRRKNWHGRGKYKEPAAPDTTNLPPLPEGWGWGTAEQLTSFITDGEHITPRRTSSGVYLLSARNVLDGRISLETVDYVPQDEYERIARRLTIEPGDVLLSCSGSVGRSAIVPEGLTFTLVRSVAVLKPVLAMGRYLSLALRSPLLRKQISARQTQTAQANIFQGKIKTLCFPLPSLSEQARLVTEVERRLSVIEELEGTVVANLQRATRLRQAILRRAFATGVA